MHTHLHVDPSPGALGYFRLWNLDILKLQWGRDRRGPAESLPLVRCLSQFSNNLANMHCCAHLPDWGIETQKGGGGLWGWDDLIALCHHLPAMTENNWRIGSSPISEQSITSGHKIHQPPRASAADSQALPRLAPGTSPVILGMPSSRGTGSRTMTPWLVPTQSRPWQISRLVTHRCFWPAERGVSMSSTPSLGDGSGSWGPPQGEEMAPSRLLL